MRYKTARISRCHGRDACVRGRPLLRREVERTTAHQIQ